LGVKITGKERQGALTALLLPSALLVTISFEALAPLVLRHLEAPLLLEISHGVVGWC
jgi:hypothetical protein